MRTSALLKLHQRQIDILDMIIKSDNNRISFKWDLKQIEDYNNRARVKDWLYPDKKNHYLKMINRYWAIKERLIRYYIDVQKRIEAMQPQLTISPAESDLLVSNQLS